MNSHWTQQLHQCQICYEKIISQGKIDSCHHCFCYQCIKHWSRIQNTCPLCKKRFARITKRIKKKNKESEKHQQEKIEEIGQKNQSRKKGEFPNIFQLFGFNEEFLSLVQVGYQSNPWQAYQSPLQPEQIENNYDFTIN